jgi:hypothetical protein
MVFLLIGLLCAAPTDVEMGSKDVRDNSILGLDASFLPQSSRQPAKCRAAFLPPKCRDDHRMIKDQ